MADEVLTDGVIIDDIYVKEIEIKSGKNGIYIVCKYVENDVEKTVKDNQKAMPQFYEILKNLKYTGARILEYPYLFFNRIMITGAKFVWKDYELKECKLLGAYKSPNHKSIVQNFCSIVYEENNKIGYTKDDIKLLNELQYQAILYARGVREQISLTDIENKEFIEE